MMSPANIDYLRVSVTDRCNLRCIYCNPLGRACLADDRKTLSTDEIVRVVRLFVQRGIRRVRLTGGEPLLREDIVDLVRRLADVAGVDDLSMTTNGVLLEPMAVELKDAGLNRVNISLDAMAHGCYEQIAGVDGLSAVLAGMHKALEVGLTPVRINCVVIRDVNVSQIEALASLSLQLPVAVRFIEYCPTSRLTGPADRYVPNRQVRGIIESRFGPLSDLVLPDTGGPAAHIRIAGAAGAVGFISGRSSMFCHRCTRLRLTSDGKVRPCLYGGHEYDVRELLRAGAGDDAIRDLLQTALHEKSRYTKVSSTAGDFLMQHVGG
jgi:cyclic pyranopterin phosphate synthase